MRNHWIKAAKVRKAYQAYQVALFYVNECGLKTLFGMCPFEIDLEWEIEKTTLLDGVIVWDRTAAGKIVWEDRFDGQFQLAKGDRFGINMTRVIEAL